MIIDGRCRDQLGLDVLIQRYQIDNAHLWQKYYKELLARGFIKNKRKS